MAAVELKVSKLVGGLQSTADYYVPDNGSTVTIVMFVGDGAYSTTSNVRLVWKYNHSSENEEVVWAIKGSSHMPFRYTIDDCDGVKKLAVVCDNAALSGVYLSGYAKIFEE